MGDPGGVTAPSGRGWPSFTPILFSASDASPSGDVPEGSRRWWPWWWRVWWLARCGVERWRLEVVAADEEVDDVDVDVLPARFSRSPAYLRLVAADPKDEVEPPDTLLVLAALRSDSWWLALLPPPPPVALPRLKMSWRGASSGLAFAERAVSRSCAILSRRFRGSTLRLRPVRRPRSPSGTSASACLRRRGSGSELTEGERRAAKTPARVLRAARFCERSECAHAGRAEPARSLREVCEKPARRRRWRGRDGAGRDRPRRPAVNSGTAGGNTAAVGKLHGKQGKKTARRDSEAVKNPSWVIDRWHPKTRETTGVQYAMRRVRHKGNLENACGAQPGDPNQILEVLAKRYPPQRQRSR